MSLIPRSDPLNLDGKIALLHPCSADLPATIARNLLKHNCRVLGLDWSPLHPSLNTAAGRHMQFLQRSVEDDGLDGLDRLARRFENEEGVMEVLVEKFGGTGGVEGVDVGVFVGGDGKRGDWRKLARSVVERMKSRGTGCVVYVDDGGGEGWVVEAAKEAVEAFEGKQGLRVNAVVNQVGIGGGEDGAEGGAASVFDKKAYETVKSLRTENDSTDEHVRVRGIANLVLFLTSKNASKVIGMRVAVDGTCQPL